MLDQLQYDMIFDQFIWRSFCIRLYVSGDGQGPLYSLNIRIPSQINWIVHVVCFSINIILYLSNTHTHMYRFVCVYP